MSNKNMNNSGMNCVSEGNGNTCSLKKLQVNRNSTNNDLEFAAEFNPAPYSQRASLASKEFKPNHQPMPVSERTAWN